jgi:hypothetical protein
MKQKKWMLVATMVTAFAAGNAGAQRTTASPVPVFIDDAYEIVLPADNTFQIKTDGLKAVHVAWLTFAGYVGGKPPRETQVLMLMPGTAAKWSAPDGGCTYEFKIAGGATPVINMSKSSFACILRDGEKIQFRVVAM